MSKKSKCKKLKRNRSNAVKAQVCQPKLKLINANGSHEDKEGASISPYYKDDLITLYNNDCSEAIGHLNDESVDLVVTSPPYNVDLGNNKKNKNPYDVYRDNKQHWEYIEWLKPAARVCINIGDPQNGRVPTHSDNSNFMKDIGYLPFAHLVWNKSQIGNRVAWGSYGSPSCPSFPTPFEHILISSKEVTRLQTKGKTDLTEDEFKAWANALWDIRPETRMKQIGHPAMFPVEIPRRLIKILSWEGATVVDCFSGAGTTGVACKELNRKYIGMELSSNYCDITVNRLKKAA